MGTEHVSANKSTVPPEKATGGPQTANSYIPQTPFAMLQRNLGNQAVQSFLKAGFLQAKLNISNPDDPDEQEADRIAGQVMQADESTLEPPLVSIQVKEGAVQAKLLHHTPLIEPQMPEAEEEKAPAENYGKIREAAADIESCVDSLKGRGQPLELSTRAFMESRFGYDFNQVRVHTDAQVAKSAETINAKAYTVGTDIVFGAGRYAPDTYEGRQLLAHELTHVAQQAGGLKPVIPEAPFSGNQNTHSPTITEIRLHRVPKDVGKKDRKDEKIPGFSLPVGVNYRIQGAIVIVRTAWIAEDESWNVMNPGKQYNKKIPELLRMFRQIGLLHWVTDQQIDKVAPRLGIEGLGHQAEIFGITLGLTAFQEFGPPPDSDIYWMSSGDGLMVVIGGKVIDANPEQLSGPGKASPELIARIMNEVEAFTGLKVLPEIRARISTAQITFDFQSKAAYVEKFSKESCENWFGKELWAAYLSKPHPETGDNLRGGKRYSETVTEDDRKWLEEWSKENLGEPKSISGEVVITKALIDALRKVDKHPLREQILALLTQEGASDGNKHLLTASLIESLMARAEAEEARGSLGLEPLDKGGEKPLFDEPVQGRIASPQLLYPGREALFYFHQESNRDAFKVPWIHTEWALLKQGEPQVLKYERIQYGELQGPAPFKYTFGEEGHFLVHVFVNHNFYWPAHFQEPVEVKSQTERLSEVEEPAYQGFGTVTTEDKLEGKYDFETSWSNELLGDKQYDEGVKVVGKLPPEFKSMTFEERLKFLEDEIKRVTELSEFYREREGPVASSIKEYSENYLTTLEALQNKLKEENSVGFRFFEVRGAFLGRQQGIGDKPLKLMAAARKDDATVTINIHDFTHLVEADTYHFSGTGPNFDVAAEHAFVTLCKSYPPGRLSMRLEQLDPDAVKPTGQFIHLELDTGTAWKDIKHTVWDPTVQIAVNLGAAVIMIFAPVSAPVVFPLLVAYNATHTVDNLAQLADKGTLRWDNVAAGVAMIGLDLLPYVGQVKKFATIAKTLRYVIDGVQIAGQMVIVTSDALQQLSKLRNEDISEIARLHAWVEETKKLNPSHPGLAEKEKELEQKIEETRRRSVQVFTDLAISGAIMLVTPVVFNHIQALTAKSDVGVLIKEGLFIHKKGVKPHYDPVRGLMVGDKSMVGSLELEELGQQYAAHMTRHHSELAATFETSPEKIRIKRDGHKVAVRRGKDGTVEITIPREMNIKEGIEAAKLKTGEKPKIPEPAAPKSGPQTPSSKEPGLKSNPAEPSIVNEQGTLQPHFEEYPDGLVHLELTRSEAYVSYRQSIDADPAREAAIYVDPDTGEHIVVQGNREFVGNEWFRESGMQRWWRLVEHYHPGSDKGARLASPEDFQAMMHPMIVSGDLTKPVSTRIRWRDPVSKIEFFTEIGYAPGVDPPYWIKYRDIEGNWQFKQFNDTPWNASSDYERFLLSEGIPLPSGGSSKTGPPHPASPPAPKAPEAKLPAFNRDQRSRIADIEAELVKFDMTWTDLGFKDKNDIARFFAGQPTADEGIRILERRLRSKLQSKAAHAEAQRPGDWNSRKSTAPSESDSSQSGPKTPEGQRLPRGTDSADSEYGGFWAGERGNSEWYSDIRALNEITGWKPVRFRRGFPDFRPWAKEQVFMKCTGIDDIDFPVADERMAKKLGYKNQTEYAEYRKVNRLTWHHVEGGQEMILVPRDLHENVPHQGGASEARAAGKTSSE